MPKRVSLIDELRQRPKDKGVQGPTSVRFTPEEYEEIKNTATSLGVTISDLIRWRNAYAIDAKVATYVESIGKNRLRMP